MGQRSPLVKRKRSKTSRVGKTPTIPIHPEIAERLARLKGVAALTPEGETLFAAYAYARWAQLAVDRLPKGYVVNGGTVDQVAQALDEVVRQDIFFGLTNEMLPAIFDRPTPPPVEAGTRFARLLNLVKPDAQETKIILALHHLLACIHTMESMPTEAEAAGYRCAKLADQLRGDPLAYLEGEFESMFRDILAEGPQAGEVTRAA